MKTTLKKIASLLICLCLIISGMAITASAAGTTTAYYEKVTVAPEDWSGKYLIVYEAEKFAFDGSKTADSASNYKTVTITNGKIDVPATDNFYFTIEKMTGGYSIKTASGKFIGQSSDANGINLGSSAAKNTITLKSNGDEIDIVSAGGAYLRFNATDGQDRFRYYKSGTYKNQKAIQLFKYTEVTTGGDEGGDSGETPVDPPVDPEEPEVTPDPEEPGQGGGETPDPTPDTPTVTSDSYVKVTEAPADWSGTYLIVYEGTTNGPRALNGALTTLDANLNGVDVTITDGVIAATDALNGATFTIATFGDGYSIKSASGKYIGNSSTSTSTNILATASSLSSNANYYTHTITHEGTYIKLLANGKQLQYNSNTNTERFRYYGSTQKKLMLYKYVEATTEPETPPVTPEPEEPSTAIKGTDVEVGSDLTANYVVSVKPEDVEGKTLEMRFTMNGVSDSVECDTSEIVDGTFTFAFEGIGAQCMSDTITASLVSIDSEGAETVHSTVNYSIKEYAQVLLNDTNSSNELKAFVSDMLRYGDAAQIYRGHNLDNLATAGIKNLEPVKEDNLPTEASKMYLETKTENPVGDVYFKSATVRFSNVNSLVIKLNAATDNTKLYVNDALVELDGTTFVTDGVSADKYGTTFKFDLYEGDEHIQTLVYSINAYAYSMHNKTDGGELTDMAVLARALYSYGASASAYAESLINN